MARTMLKVQKQLTQETAAILLAQGKTGVLAVHGDDGYPYAVPVNYVYADHTIYVHCAKQGYKIDAIRANPKVCFTAVLERALIESALTTKFESVIATGRAEILPDGSEKKQAMEQLIHHLTPSNLQGGMETLTRLLPTVGIIKITVETLTGKSNP